MEHLYRIDVGFRFLHPTYGLLGFVSSTQPTACWVSFPPPKLRFLGDY